MKILYLTNAPIPQNRETDAHFQELDLLVERFDGTIISAFPLSRPNSLFPRTLYGMHNRRAIRLAAKEADVIHVFSPVLYPYSYINRLGNKPIIYSTLTPVSAIKKIDRVHRYVVYDRPSADKLISADFKNVSFSPPFVDFEKVDLNPPSTGFTLMMASAPWEKSQFRSKGVLLLLELLGKIPELHIIFIWRDILFDEMHKLVQFSAYADRISLVNGRVDILPYLEKSHAVVLLAEHASLVKSYPHSLMEGLLAGRPVITSPTIPMSQLVQEQGYGEVLTSFSIEALEAAVSSLINDYQSFRERLTALPEDSFDKASFLSFYQQLYDGLRSAGT